MSVRRLAAMALAAGIVCPAFAQAQGAGGVPPYAPPAPVGPPVRDGTLMAPPSAAGGDAFGRHDATIASFADAYRRHGKPRLALYWNRQLSEALSDWYADTRVVSDRQSHTTMEGDIALERSSHSRNTLEVQRRVPDSRRGELPESFEWEFQDAFLAPFLDAGATVIDRGAMMRLAAAEAPAAGDNTVEVRGLHGKADYLLEILVAPNWRSSTGYELRTRIIDVRSGAILAMVNAKGLPEWNPDKPVRATAHGFVDPRDAEEAEDSFGPLGGDRVRATDHGFVSREKPPKLPAIARNLAVNTMAGMMRQWK